MITVINFCSEIDNEPTMWETWTNMADTLPNGYDDTDPVECEEF